MTPFFWSTLPIEQALKASMSLILHRRKRIRLNDPSVCSDERFCASPYTKNGSEKLRKNAPDLTGSDVSNFKLQTTSQNSRLHRMHPTKIHFYNVRKYSHSPTFNPTLDSTAVRSLILFILYCSCNPAFCIWILERERGEDRGLHLKIEFDWSHVFVIYRPPSSIAYVSWGLRVGCWV